MKGRAIICVLIVALTVSALAEEPTQSTPAEKSALARIFWGGITALDLIFTSVGVLSGGADRGEVWMLTFGPDSGAESGPGDDCGVAGTCTGRCHRLRPPWAPACTVRHLRRGDRIVGGRRWLAKTGRRRARRHGAGFRGGRAARATSDRDASQRIVGTSATGEQRGGGASIAFTGREPRLHR